MQLFEQKFKQYLKEDYRFGYSLGDEDTFLGFKINDYNLKDHFPEIYDHVENIYDTYDKEDRQASEAEIEAALTPSFMRDAVGDEETDRFLDYAKKLTKINTDILNIIGSHTHADMSGAESMADLRDDVDEDAKKEAFGELSEIFGDSDAEYSDYNLIGISMYSNFTGERFEPYLKVFVENIEDGEEYSFYLDSTEDGYYNDFAEKIGEVKDIAANTLNVSFD